MLRICGVSVGFTLGVTSTSKPRGSRLVQLVHLPVLGDPDPDPATLAQHRIHLIERHCHPPVPLIFEFGNQLLSLRFRQRLQNDVDVLCRPRSPSEDRDVPTDDDVLHFAGVENSCKRALESRDVERERRVFACL
ncbi:MAG: hypothetical protein J07HQW2_02210 [Haloquadratum walsbyi J07HQW2]|uniref:Uncharacterized protein n=1 Tax=Haloquadratum walsbyi J07HQW2 TaxID=1238425 RepID=U1NFA1_9EURY|nr:MAG: hypothetical protein J07HQW2_02210 [Haloquadratum walsbyi J07HQW2]